MNEHNILRGERLELILKNKKPGFSGKIYSSFERELDDGSIIITAPVYRASVYKMDINEAVNVVFYKEKLQISFDAKVTGKFSEGNSQLVKIVRQGPVVSFQRRDHYRLDVKMKANLIRNYFGKNGSKKISSEITVTNISGGGLNAQLSDQLAVGERISILLYGIKGLERTEIPAEVRWVRGIEGKTYRYTIGLMFKNANSMVREKIIQYIFKEQQERIKAPKTDEEEILSELDDFFSLKE